jgi:hypothetical protein
MKQKIIILYILCSILGIIAGLLFLPDTFSIPKKIFSGLLSGIGCILILTAGRLLRPDQEETS